MTERIKDNGKNKATAYGIIMEERIYRDDHIL